MARLEGIEPPTDGLEIRCSILLSYRRSTSSKRGLGDCVGICASGTTFLTTSARSLSLTTA